jgi:hypothetical protein
VVSESDGEDTAVSYLVRIQGIVNGLGETLCERVYCVANLRQHDTLEHAKDADGVT